MRLTYSDLFERNESKEAGRVGGEEGGRDGGRVGGRGKREGGWEERTAPLLFHVSLGAQSHSTPQCITCSA